MLPPRNQLSWIDGELTALDAQNLRRRLATRSGPQGPTITIDGRTLINFGSNDYLSLANDERLVTSAIEATRREGWGAGASPLITGHSQSHQRLEQRLADFLATEAALVFPSGFAANVGTIAALAGPGDVIFSDAKNHASLIDGCRLSKAKIVVYPHCDLAALSELLSQYRVTSGRISAGDSAARDGRVMLVTDALFSMDGDLAPLAGLAELAERHQVMLMVDEAHATGVFGEHGRGVAELLGVESRIDVRMGTLSKALASAGGFVAGRRSLIEWLIHRARPYVFSTAHPPAIAAAAVAALDIVRDEPQRRRQLLASADRLRKILRSQGWRIGESASQIIPVVVEDAKRVMQLSAELRERGFLVPGIRPPTVPQDESLLRISLCYGHTTAMMAGLVEALAGLTFASPAA